MSGSSLPPAASPDHKPHPATLFGVRLRLLLKGLTLILSLALAGWAMRWLGVLDMLDERWMAEHAHSPQGIGVLLLAGSLAVGVGAPRQAVCFAFGLAFGFGWGMVWALVASMLGCLGCVLFARLLARELVLHKFADRVRRLDAFLMGHPVTMTILIRFLPVGSNLLTNLVAGVSSVPLRPYLIGTFLGYLPQTIVFVLLGSGVQVGQPVRIAVSALLFVASAFLGVMLYKRMRHGRSLDVEDADAEE